MPIPYNKDFQVYKSAALQAIDCRPTGVTKTIGAPGEEITFSTVFTAAEAIEVGECIAMVRVPKNFQVTAARMAWSEAGVQAFIGLGDPFCCGRLLGPINPITHSASAGAGAQTNDCGVLTKTGGVADGCGLGYIYTCETDLIVTNAYGDGSFGIGGGKSGTASSGGGVPGPLPSGWRCFVSVTGQVVPNPNA